MIKKLVTILLLFIILAYPVLAALNTKSIDLERTSSQYLSITDGDQTGLDLTSDFTYESWINVESFGVDGLFSKWLPGANKSFIIRMSATYVQLFTSSSGANSVFKTISFSFSSATWYHIAVTYDASAGKVELFVDGATKGSQTGLYTSIFNGTGTVMFGQQNAAVAIYDGKMDEIIVWDDVRTPTEISESYNSGDGKTYNGDEANMVGYWRMEDNLLDETSNNNDLTNNNSATYSSDVPFAGSADPVSAFGVPFITW